MKRTRALAMGMVVITVLSFTICTICVSPCFAQADRQQAIDALRRHPKLIHPALVMKDFEQGKTHTRVIVMLAEPSQLREGGDFKDMAFRDTVRAEVRAAQDGVISRLDPDAVRVRTRFTYVFGFSAEVTLEGLRQLTELDDVVSINKSRIFRPHLAQGIPLIGASVVRGTYDGYGVGIAICDTGIDYTHPRLGGSLDMYDFPNTKVIGGEDVGGDGDLYPMDEQGHGTCCAGIAAGNLGTVGDYIGGVAPGAKLYAVKISPGAEGSATEDDMIEGWEWCITHQHDNPTPIMVVSTSFGGPCYDDEDNALPCTSPCDGESPGMTAAAAACVQAGMILFVSSGNEGFCNGMAHPACISHVNSVGAVYDADVGPAPGGGDAYCIHEASCTGYSLPSCGDEPWGWGCDDATTAADRVTCYSNTATFLELFAPSNNAYTTDIVGEGGYNTAASPAGDYNDGFGGTSAACPYAAGAAACLQSWARANRGAFLSPAQVRARLLLTGDPVTDTKISITRPRIDLAAAVGSNPILHRHGAVYDTVLGWITTTPPYYPGVDYARDLEHRSDDSALILHRYGAVYDSSAGWITTTPPNYPGVDYARDLELETVVIFDEDFDGGAFPPAGWSVVNTGGNCVWQSNTDWGRANLTGGTGVCADADSYLCGDAHWPPVMDTELRTPVLDLSAVYNATLSFRASYEDYEYAALNDYAEVDISTDGGTSWTNLLSWDEDYPDENQPHAIVTLDITPYCGSATVIIRFHYVAPEWSWWFEVDDVQITTDAMTILHRDGALWNNLTGWNLATPPFKPGTDYARALEYRTDGSFVILDKEGRLYDSTTGWVTTTPPYYPGVLWAVDLELTLDDQDYVILHKDGALWSVDAGWDLATTHYYPGTAYAVDLEFPPDLSGTVVPGIPFYLILHKDGATYDSEVGWYLKTPPYHPGTNYAVDLISK